MKFKTQHSKFTIYNFLLPVACCLITGCQPANVRNDNIDYGPIAGTWKAEKGPWQVVISDEGKVVSAIHPLGEVFLVENVFAIYRVVFLYWHLL